MTKNSTLKRNKGNKCEFIRHESSWPKATQDGFYFGEKIHQKKSQTKDPIKMVKMIGTARGRADQILIKSEDGRSKF